MTEQCSYSSLEVLVVTKCIGGGCMPLLWWCRHYQVQLLADENKELWLMLRAKYPSCSSSSSPTEETSSSLSIKAVRHINPSCGFPGKLVTFCVLCTLVITSAHFCFSAFQSKCNCVGFGLLMDGWRTVDSPQGEVWE